MFYETPEKYEILNASDKTYIIISNPYIYKKPVNIINKNSSSGLSEYIYVWIESSYKKYKFPIHLWERLFKVNELKNNDVIKQIFDLACLSRPELDGNIYNKLYTNGLKKKYLLSSYQIYLTDYKHTIDYIDEILNIAKNYFKLYITKQEFLKLLKIEDKFPETDDLIQLTNEIKYQKVDVNINESQSPMSNELQNSMSNKSQNIEINKLQNIEIVELHNIQTNEINKLQNTQVNVSQKIEKDETTYKINENTEKIITYNKEQENISEINTRQNVELIENQNTKIIEFKNIEINECQEITFSEKSDKINCQEMIYPEKSDKINYFYKHPRNLRPYEKTDYSDTYKKLYAYKWLGLNDDKINLKQIVVSIKFIKPFYIKELENLKDLLSHETNNKKTFKNLVKLEFEKEKEFYKYDTEFLETYIGLKDLPNSFIYSSNQQTKEKYLKQLKSINEFEIMYLIYERYFYINKKTDCEIYQLNICIAYVRENVNKIINIIKNIRYIPFKKWFL